MCRNCCNCQICVGKYFQYFHTSHKQTCSFTKMRVNSVFNRDYFQLGWRVFMATERLYAGVTHNVFNVINWSF